MDPRLLLSGPNCSPFGSGYGVGEKKVKFKTIGLILLLLFFGGGGDFEKNPYWYLHLYFPKPSGTPGSGRSFLMRIRNPAGITLTPLNLRLVLASARLASSMTSSCIQRQARLPTVVSWAGCRWVNPIWHHTQNIIPHGIKTNLLTLI